MATRTQSELTASVSRDERRASRVQVHQWAVEVIAGPDKGKKAQTLSSLLRVGSEPANDLVLTDPTVSRRHLEIERTPKGLLLRDLGSRNGTTLDSRHVLQAFVEPGDRVALGKTKLAIKRDAKPTSVEAMIDQSVGRALDLLGLDWRRVARWGEALTPIADAAD